MHVVHPRLCHITIHCACVLHVARACAAQTLLKAHCRNALGISPWQLIVRMICHEPNSGAHTPFPLQHTMVIHSSPLMAAPVVAAPGMLAMCVLAAAVQPAGKQTVSFRLNLMC